MEQGSVKFQSSTLTDFLSTFFSQHFFNKLVCISLGCSLILCPKNGKISRWKYPCAVFVPNFSLANCLQIFFFKNEFKDFLSKLVSQISAKKLFCGLFSRKLAKRFLKKILKSVKSPLRRNPLSNLCVFVNFVCCMLVGFYEFC